MGQEKRAETQTRPGMAKEKGRALGSTLFQLVNYRQLFWGGPAQQCQYRKRPLTQQLQDPTTSLEENQYVPAVPAADASEVGAAQRLGVAGSRE